MGIGRRGGRKGMQFRGGRRFVFGSRFPAAGGWWLTLDSVSFLPFVSFLVVLIQRESNQSNDADRQQYGAHVPEWNPRVVLGVARVSFHAGFAGFTLDSVIPFSTCFVPLRLSHFCLALVLEYSKNPRTNAIEAGCK